MREQKGARRHELQTLPKVHAAHAGSMVFAADNS
jgi:hypothetical protein